MYSFASFGLGHPKSLQTDLNLILQIATIIVILVSLLYKNRRQIKQHAVTMAIGMTLHVLSLSVVMVPLFLQSYWYFSAETAIAGVQTMWLHAFSGGISIILGLPLIVLWAIHPSNTGPCYKRKRIMDVAIVLWLFSLTFGILTYIFFYA